MLTEPDDRPRVLVTLPLRSLQSANHNHNNGDNMTTHPSENPSYATKHRAAFMSDPPKALAVGDMVWILDHYYPGKVIHVTSDGHAIVSTPQWDYAVSKPMVRNGTLVDIRLTYWPHHYPQLRVDPACAEFWPAPAGWASVERSGGNTLVES